MQIPHSTHTKQKLKWIVSLLCLLVIASAASLNYHQTLSANSLAVTASSLAITDLEPIQQNTAVKVQDIEKMARSVDKLATTPSIWPANGVVTSGFSWRQSPWGEGNELHQGIDIANSLGTPVVATADGQVVQSEWAGGYGNVVQIDHGNGIATVYGHNSGILVKVGQSVRKGQVISLLGSTGKSTGPHVHYEVRVNGTPVDPVRFLVL
jgi:murein DD-endopeptidase MepM/ murein hydrolase activator NlpD